MHRFVGPGEAEFWCHCPGAGKELATVGDQGHQIENEPEPTMGKLGASPKDFGRDFCHIHSAFIACCRHMHAHAEPQPQDL